jgi:hypothetical protein
LPELKKNQLNNIMVVMVDKTDFASVESGLGADDINIRLYGVAQGVSTLASTITVSKAARLVHSGIFQITLKAGETDAHDHYMLRLSSTSTVSCATQYIPLTMLDHDDSDIMSRLSDFYSDFQSRVPKELASKSLLSDVHSDLRSQIGGITLSVSDISDIASAVWANTIGARVDSRVLLNLSRISDTYSLVSDLQSDFQSRVPKRVATDSQLSDVHSDLRSQIGGIPTSVSASDISDIASAVWAHTVGTRVDSRVLLNLSRVSDAYSLVSDFYSDFQSRVPKRVATDSQLSDVHSDLRSQVGGITASVSASDISDIASAVWAHTVGTRVDSRVLLNLSRISDTYSLLTAVASNVSDIESQLDATNATVSNINSVVTAIQSDLPTRATKNTQLSNFPFLMVDAADHVTAKTGLTVTCQVSIDGGAFANSTNSAAEIGSGWYKITLTAAEMNGDTIALKFTAAGADARNVTMLTQPT